MAERSEGDVALACASALVGAFVGHGVAGACLSPGSRSTPLALALARDGRIAIHVHLDERSSAFFALGMAKATGRPAIVVTTSGTAVANLYPAVVEAAMSRTPMILLTADRPPELRGTGANQTIDQVGMFGSYPRWATDADPPGRSRASVEAWRSLGIRAVASSLGPPGGPVHLNLPFREPLVPARPIVATAGALGVQAGEIAGHGARAVAADRDPTADGVDRAALDDVGRLVSSTEHGLVLAGWFDPWDTAEAIAAVERLVTLTGWPLLAEPMSGSRRPPYAVGSAQHLLADDGFAGARIPDVVLQLGGAPTSRAAQALVARAGTLVVVNAGPADPSHAAALTFSTDPGTWATAVTDRIGAKRPTSDWWRAWAAADASVRTAVDRAVDGFVEPFEGRIARDLVSCIPAGSTVFAGSSMPVRDLEAYMAPRAGVRVVGNRGASGIDGSVSTTLGLAATAAASGAAVTFGLVGDLAMLHDAGALLWAGQGGAVGTNAVFVVPNNRGGGIFDHLAVRDVPEHERLFVTPHHVDLARLCDAAGLAHAVIDRPGDLVAAIQSAGASGGLHVIEVPIDRTSGLRARATVRAAVREALAGLGYPEPGGAGARS